MAESVDTDAIPERVPKVSAGQVLLPLAVDLDGTLVSIDLLHESFIDWFRAEPFALLRLLRSLRRGKAAFKAEVCARGSIDPSLLPYNQDLIAYLREQRRAGRTIGLFTAADQSVARAIANHIGVFGIVRASDGITNLRGASKLEAIRQELGEHFAYAGDHPTIDAPILVEAEQVVLVGPVERLRAVLPSDKLIEAEFPVAKAGLATWARALRLRHWSKNILVFVSLILGLHLSVHEIASAVLLFMLFGMLASGTYLLNDLLDLSADRQHYRKSQRPLASGAITARSGAIVAVGLLVAAGVGSILLPWQASITLFGYLIVTLAYSIVFKRQPFADVVVLACLFTARVLAGATLTPDRISPWLLTCSMLLFVSLAMVKRYAELERVVAAGKSGVASRGYTAKDLPLLLSSGVAAGFATLVVFTMYLINDQYPREIYHHPVVLWAVIPVLLLWTMRIWHLTAQGQMDDDPLLFAINDRVSLALGGLTVLVLIGAWL